MFDAFIGVKMDETSLLSSFITCEDITTVLESTSLLFIYSFVDPVMYGGPPFLPPFLGILRPNLLASVFLGYE